MKHFLTALLLVLVGIAQGCSQSRQDLTIKTVYLKTTLPPIARMSHPLSKIPDKDLSQIDVTNLWAADRNARNNTEVGRLACVAAVDATQTQ